MENEDGGTVESDPSVAGTGTNITNPSWNITEETITPTSKNDILNKTKELLKTK